MESKVLSNQIMKNGNARLVASKFVFIQIVAFFVGETGSREWGNSIN